MHGLLLLAAVAPDRDRALGGLLAAHDEQDGDLPGHAVADLLVEALVAVVQLHPHEPGEELVPDPVGIGELLLGDWDDEHLDRGEPGGKRAGKVLDEEGNEPLVGAQRRPVEHPGPVELAVRAHVGHIEPVLLGGHGVHLVRGGGLLPAHHVLDLHVDFGPVEGCLAPDRLVVQAHLLHGLHAEPLGSLPEVRPGQELAGLLLVRKAQPHVPPGKLQELVVLQVELHDLDELLLGLLGLHVDVGVVHGHAPDPEEAGQLAGLLEPVDVAVLREPEGKVPVGPGPGLVDHVVVGAVHGLEVEDLLGLLALLGRLLHHHGRKHGIFVVGQVSGPVVEPFLGDLRSGHAHIAILELVFLGELLELVPDHRAVGQPEGKPLAHLVADVEDVELCPELPVVPLEGLLPLLEIRLELFGGRKGQAVDPGEHGVFFAAPPVGSSHPVQLERLEGKLARALHVRPLAHIGKLPVPVERNLLEPLGPKLLHELGLVRLARLLGPGEGLVQGQVVVLEGLVRLDLAPHLLFDGRKVLHADANPFGELEVIVEPVFHRRPEPEPGPRVELGHRRGHHVRQGMPNLVELELLGTQTPNLFLQALGHLLPPESFGPHGPDLQSIS